MALWSKKKEEIKVQPLDRTFEFNRDLLKSQMENLSTRLSAFTDDLGVAVVQEVIELARNIQILDVNRYKDEKGFWVHQGRLQALSDLADYLHRSKQALPKKEEPGKPRDQINTRSKRTDHQAGIAI